MRLSREHRNKQDIRIQNLEGTVSQLRADQAVSRDREEKLRLNQKKLNEQSVRLSEELHKVRGQLKLVTEELNIQLKR